MCVISRPSLRVLLCLAVISAPCLLSSCGRSASADSPPGGQAPTIPEVSVVKAVRSNLHQSLIVSSELVPFQQIDVYAKESGFVHTLNVDYGTHVKTGDLMAVLEIPELNMQIQEDEAEVKDASEEVARYQNQLNQLQAQEKVTHLQYTRINGVAQAKPGLVAQQEVDDWQGKDLAANSQVAAGQSALQAAQSQLDRAKAKQRHDQALLNYADITAPFTGVVTKRYANYGTLMQSGINSTQALPLVQLSEDDLFRLVIPVPESYVPDVRVGDRVAVRIPVLNRTFPGTVARFSVDVEEQTRTMHTEVDVRNPEHVLMPGMYAEATLTMNLKKGVVVVPPETINVEGDKRSVWVVSPSGSVEKRPVTLGVETPEKTEIISGLREGEMVAAGDRGRLKPGEQVRPKVVQLLEYRETE